MNFRVFIAGLMMSSRVLFLNADWPAELTPKDWFMDLLEAGSTNSDRLATLIRSGIDLSFLSQAGTRTFLMNAAISGNDKGIKLLLSIKTYDPEANIDIKAIVNAQDAGGNTALMLAASAQRTSTIDALLSCPEIDVSLTNNKGKTATVIAWDIAQINGWAASTKPPLDHLYAKSKETFFNYPPKNK